MNDNLKSTRQTHKVEVIRHGRDEMNLVEYPFASLWKNTEPGTEILHEWETTHPRTGKIVKAFWRVTGDPQLGLPTARDEQLYLVLMELTQEAGLQTPVVHFTRHDLLKRLGWPHNQKGYNLLRDGFTRLNAVAITSQNAFWDARARSFRITGAGLIEAFDILEEQPRRKSPRQGALPLSFFKWNDVLFDSFQAGYLKALDLGFAQSLDSPVALRLYRYLDKKSFDARRTFEVELSALCERHLGMRSSPYPSKHKERLRPAHEELIERGFLQSVDYEPMKSRKGEKVRYTFAPRKDRTAPEPAASSPEPVPAPLQPSLLDAVQEVAVGAHESRACPAALSPTQSELLQRMLDLRISPAVARELLREASESELKLQLDCLSDREPRDPAATFVRALRERWEIPLKYLERQDAQDRAKKARAALDTEKTRAAQEEASTALKRASQEEESAALDKKWEEMGAQEREDIEREAISRLGVLGRTGRAKGALVAMRRAIQRERMGRAETGRAE